MRLIGHLTVESAARTFSDYLFVQGMDNKLEFQPEQGWGIWVNDEDKLQSATRLLEKFQANPAAPEYQVQAQEAVRLRQEREQREEAWRKRLYDRRHLFKPLRGYGIGTLTLVLIIISVVVFFLSDFGNWARVSFLAFNNFWAEGDTYYWQRGLASIRHGQVWRLITPIFLHANFLHIFFNMWWLKDLGSMIEARQTWVHLLALVLVVGAGSNLAQYFVTHSPIFGGMSGVVYGLLGYIWLRGKFDPASGLFVHPSTVTLMLVWLVLCFTGWLGPIANYAHLAGLALGGGWGYLSSLRYR
ncbi:MAG TPA: rhomboid family intramembrane serine protease [Verrucomicrobiae bacterium]|nr:rhomboid family intramembrane serine protease [Verrucomicrobiae bacterium]